MASKLKEITTKYHTFEDNQVLTADQLNEFVTYFDDQDRLSRVFLSGVGVVCGFKILKTSNKIFISPGVGVTTDGDLLQLKHAITDSELKTLTETAISYSHFKKFEDDSAHYAPFQRTIISNRATTVLDLYELFPDPIENSKPISDLESINEMVVLLYLESYAKEGDLCTAIDCDNQGIEQVNRLRVLLVSKTDAEFIASGDSVFSKYNIAQNYFSLPEIAVKRVILNEISTSKYEELKRAYYEAINNKTFKTDLNDGITQIVNDFGGILQLDIRSSVLNTVLAKLKAHLSFSAYLVPFNIQYRYDFLKDVVDTYNEIKALLLSLKEICSPDIDAFPKHLMLGLLSEINEDPKELRHSFYKSPAVGCSSDNIQKAKSLVLRLFELINRFGTQTGDIKITPSNKLPELSKRSIPFYYNITEDLLKSWDYFKSQRFEETTNLCYNRDKLADLPHIKDPLEYNTDTFDFYRIEGHQGKDYRDVLEELDGQKRKYGLSFDVKALSVNINSENLDIDDYECEFEDLTVMLKAWTAEQDCILAQVSNFFSGFSTKVPGANVKEAELDIKRNVKANFASIGSLPVATKLGAPKTATVTKGRTTMLYQPVTIASVNVVEDNLVTIDDTIGAEMKKAFDENIGGSANDIIASATYKLKDKVDTEEWNADPDTKEFVVTKSVELMAHTHVLTHRMPTAVAVVDTATINDYKLSLSQLCALVQKLKAGYQSTQLSVELRAFTGLLINQLSTVCCSGKKLEILLEEVNKRKDQILLKLQLSKFYEKHPGLEHKAGVEPGGTFVLVYKNQEVVSDEVSITEKLASTRLASANVLTATKNSIADNFLNIDRLSVVEKQSLLKTANSLLKYDTFVGNLQRIETLERFVPVSSVPDNTVVADFALPYMCCSDCAPVNYIISKPPATLRLEKDKYCLLTDTGPILFEVTPADGVVAPDPVTAGLKIEGKKLIFEPATFPQNMLGKPIRFTVNSQVTDAVLTVYQGIETDFRVPEEPTEQATHTFVPSGKLEGAKFLWEFGDGNSSSERNPTHTYKLPVNDKNRVTVLLHVTAANGICKTSVPHDIVFTELETTISIEPDQFCENDKTPYTFTVEPENSKVEIKGDGVRPNGSGGFVFVPAAAKVGSEIEFLLNGEPSGVTVIVHAAPQASCVPKQEGNQLIITNNSKNATGYKWTINRNVHETTSADPVVIDLTPNSPNEWRIELIATGADSCLPSTTTQIFKTKFIEEPPVNNCVEEAKAAIVADQNILNKINPTDTSVVIEILEQTQKVYSTVIEKIDEYLNGSLNNMLEELFPQLLQHTSDMIEEMSGDKEVQAQLILLLELQLRLFYTVLGCQSNEMLKEFGDIISGILQQIQNLLARLQKQQIVFSNKMKTFIEAYAQKVNDLLLLPDHLKLIISKKLI